MIHELPRKPSQIDTKNDDKTGGDTWGYQINKEDMLSNFAEKRFLLSSKYISSQFLEDQLSKSNDIKKLLTENNKLVWKNIE